MKKIAVGIISAVLLAITLVPSQAATEKSLVIIDSYFDSRVYNENVSCITITNTKCTDVAKVTTNMPSAEVNHGNAMAEVAKKQHPSLSIILLLSTTPSAKTVNPVNAGNFIDALNWVNTNSSKVGAVSVSRYFNGKVGCSPAAVNVASYGGLTKADDTIRSLIANLKSKGIPVFVSTGNKPGKNIDYPACITDTVSVGTGEINSSGVLVSANALDENTDYVASSNLYSYNSPVFGLIPQTTSSATVAVAAQWLKTGSLSNKVVQVTP
jgi:hypothetical protein